MNAARAVRLVKASEAGGEGERTHVIGGPHEEIGRTHVMPNPYVIEDAMTIVSAHAANRNGRAPTPPAGVTGAPFTLPLPPTTPSGVRAVSSKAPSSRPGPAQEAGAFPVTAPMPTHLAAAPANAPGAEADSSPAALPVKTGGARVFAFFALAMLVGLVGYVGREGYRAATDAFIAPIILSPDNDIVIANKLKATEIAVERTKASAEFDAIDADIAACDTSIKRLKELYATAKDGLAWTKASTERQAAASLSELKTLGGQRWVLGDMLAKQKVLTDEARANLEAGLISRPDYAKEAQALSQLRLALLENERSRVQSSLASKQVTAAQKSLDGRSGAPLPEALVREDQMVRIELDILKLESERRAKASEKKVAQDKLARIDELDKQLKSRPVFRAMEHNLEVGFVPYTQIDAVGNGATVYDCIWGIFHCKAVGKVTELVPGEVVLPDPWGNQARGQYAVLELKNHDAARSKTLRVRGGVPFVREERDAPKVPQAAPPGSTADAVSAR